MANRIMLNQTSYHGAGAIQLPLLSCCWRHF